MVACWNLMSGDCRVLLRDLKARGVRFDSCVTDAPYEINFMSKKWDNTGIAFHPETWKAVYDVLKPGAYLVAFGGCRSHHRMWCAIEDAGFNIADTLMWLFGSGMPKSKNIGLYIDKSQGVKRDTKKVTRRRPMIRHADENIPNLGRGNWYKHAELHLPDREPITEDAKQWHGFGTGLKPSYEPVILAQKPRDGTIVQNVLKHGTGALNIEACRVPGVKDVPTSGSSSRRIYGVMGPVREGMGAMDPNIGRWPSNLLHDGSDEVEAAFAAFGEKRKADGHIIHSTISLGCSGSGIYGKGKPFVGASYVDSGSASRFFYTAKADNNDRAWSRHTTVKPLELMHWLVRLVTPPGGSIIDPFCGSGTTLQAAVEQGFNAVGCEITPEYVADIERRMATFCAWYPRRDPFMPLPRRTAPVAAVKPVRRPLPGRA